MEYLSASRPLRRQLNQAFFKKIFIGPDGSVLRVEHTEAFGLLLAEDLVPRLKAESRTFHRLAKRASKARKDRSPDVSASDLSLWLSSKERTVVVLSGQLLNPRLEVMRILDRSYEA